MLPFYEVGGVGQVFVPTQFRDFAPEDVRIKLFTNQDLERPNRIFSHIKRGGVAALSGDSDLISNTVEFINRKKDELVKPSPNQERKGRKRDFKSSDRPRAEKKQSSPLLKLMILVDASGLLQVEPTSDLPYLLELIGENPEANQDCPFLIPVPALKKIQDSLQQPYETDALEKSLVVSENVLPPQSKDTIHLFQQGFWCVKDSLPMEAAVLDLGCGSGILSILAAHRLAGCKPRVLASDILPEAIATTRINLYRFNLYGAQVEVTRAGDLFEPIGNQKFDLIVFNAPWVVARCRSRAEIAIHDENQNTVRRFLAQTQDYLTSCGQVLLGYADHSGQKMITNLETMFETHGFLIQDVFRKRVPTHRSKKKWENITVYRLCGS